MPKLRRLVLTIVAAMATAMAVSTPVLAIDCNPLLEDFNRLVDSGNEALAQNLVDKIATSAECGQYQIPVQRRLSALRLKMAQLMMARGRPVADYERLLLTARAPEVLWQASATLGEVRFGERRFSEAAEAFDLAIEIVKNESRTPVSPSKFEIEGLIQRSAEARLLAANAPASEGGRKFVKTATDQRDGTLGGLYSRSVRGIIPRAVPVPITFEYGTTNFTSVGEAAVRELLEVLKEQKPSHVLLVGHTDVRGSAEFNMKLSQDRADAVASFLQQNGLTTAIKTEGKGANEPLRLFDTSGLSEDDIYALNRRVEWRRE